MLHTETVEPSTLDLLRRLQRLHDCFCDEKVCVNVLQVDVAKGTSLPWGLTTMYL